MRLMEGDPEDSEEDVREDEGLTVLWERCIKQSIIVDLSEDESLHLSDLEGSLDLRLTRAESAPSERSVHLSGSTRLLALDATSSEVSSVSSRSEEVQESGARRANTTQGDPEPASVDLGGNTSDEDQDDLPYDGTLGSAYFNRAASCEGQTVQASPEVSDTQDLLQEAAMDDGGEASKLREVGPLRSSPPDIHQVLLRHFSQEQLLKSGWQIETETLPEVSLLESLSETATHNSASVSVAEKTNVASSSEDEPETEVDHLTAAAGKDLRKPGQTQQRDGLHRVPLLRTRSFTEVKYGQGQVHYRLPDFSKVAPKVKIPKAAGGPARPGPQSSSSIQRAQSSPGMLDLISRVLEDSLEPPEKSYVFLDKEQNQDQDQASVPALVHHLQVKYDQLLTKYEEAETRIHQMRFQSNVPSDLKLHDEAGWAEWEKEEEQQEEEEVQEEQQERPRGHSPPSDVLLDEGDAPPVMSQAAAAAAARSGRGDEPSDGDRMTSELRDVIQRFTQKVEEFKLSVNGRTMSTTDQQRVLRSMMEAQDQLERNYISTKEEHRALEMQNYMGLRRNTGTFDRDRLVEGDLFRIGMHLDHIKETIDQNVREQVSPPHSTSTPKEVKLRPPCTDSPSPSLHKFSVAEFSIGSFNPPREAEHEDLKEDGELVEDGFDQNMDSPLTNTQRDTCHSRGSLGFLEAPGEEEEGHGEEERSSVWPEEEARSDITASLSEASSTPPQRKKTNARANPLGGVVSPQGPCDWAHLALVVSSRSSEPPLDSSSVSQLQRIVSPETDSGFGSSCLNQPSSALFLPILRPQRAPSQNDAPGSSDSDGSDPRTAIHPPALRGRQQSSCDLTGRRGATSVELWVESTTKEVSVHRHGSDPLHHHTDPSVRAIAMETEGGGSPLHSCSCNSEAIEALQSEVSRLKKELQDGLVQLPHLTEKMDYLTSRYKRERRSHKSKTSSEKPTGRSVSELGSCPVRIEDWISSDMDLSRSKGSDNGRTSFSEITMSFHDSPPGGRRVSREAEPQNILHTDILRGLYSTERGAPLGAVGPLKPLHHFSYTSSSSLPASYKVQEPPSQSSSHHRRRSTQSDSALLSSNVFFQRPFSSPASAASRSHSRTGRRRGSKEDMSRTLDQAIEVARSMKQSTDHMARRLSADLAHAQFHRTLHSPQPPGGSKHQTS